MFRFLHVLILNAWRGMRRANGTPAIIITLAAVCVLFVGSNASARASIQTAMHIVGLPVALPPDAPDPLNAQSGTNESVAHDSDKKSSTKTESHATGSNAPDENNATTANGESQSTHPLTASVSLVPPTVVPVCQQGVMLNNVQSAQLTLSQPTATASNFTWSWETRIDSGSNTGPAPLNSAEHAQAIDAGVQIVQINSNDPTAPLVSAAANTNYAYSFRLIISGPFIANSPWVSVPQATNTTCPS